MTNRPDSMIAAAKKVAQLARMPWPVVQRTYRALQAAQFLPISRGRAIWYAHPNLIGTLLIGLACPERALGDCVTTFREATPNGDGFEPLSFKHKLSQLLSEEAAAADLERIEFDAFANRVVIITKAGGADLSKVETHYHLDLHGARHPSALIQTRTIILGTLIRELQANVLWRTSSDAPYGEGDEDSTLEQTL